MAIQAWTGSSVVGPIDVMGLQESPRLVEGLGWAGLRQVSHWAGLRHVSLDMPGMAGLSDVFGSLRCWLAGLKFSGFACCMGPFF